MGAVKTTEKVETTRRSALRWLCMSAAALTLTATSVGSNAAPTPTPTLSVQLSLFAGTTSGKPNVPAGWPELGKSPWNSYDTYVQQGATKPFALALSTATTESLPDGSTLEMTYLTVADANGTQVPKLQLVIKNKAGSQLLSAKYAASKGARHLPISLPYQTGNLVVALQVL